MKMTDPYSPTLPAKASAAPVSRAGVSSGRTTRRIVCYREAPSVAEDSSHSISNSRMIGSTARTTNGNPTNTAMSMPRGVNATFAPSLASAPRTSRSGHRDPRRAVKAAA
jgi:hypothetical protein